MKRALLSIVVLVGSGSARAQAPAPDADSTEVTLTPAKADQTSCLPLDLTPGALINVPRVGKNVLATPIPWSEFDVQGTLVDDRATVKALLEPTMQMLRTSLSTATLHQLAQLTARFGYQLVGHVSQDVPTGTKLILYLAPLPMVRAVSVSTELTWKGFIQKLLDEEVRRRMSIRTGSYLPWEPIRRQCALLDEQHRIEEFLFDEGYFGARVRITATPDSMRALKLHVEVTLGEDFRLGRVTIACPPGFQRGKGGRCIDPVTNTPSVLEVSEDRIKKLFAHRSCIGPQRWGLCVGAATFTRAQHQDDVQKVKELFQQAGFYGVRVTSSEMRQSIDRKQHTVNPVLTIDQRRRVEVPFEGHDRDVVSDEQLRAQLTFSAAGSADDVEAAESARAITTFLQTRGYFDAGVTWSRDSIDVEAKPGSSEPGVHYDKITFHIAMGNVRQVAGVAFVGNHAITTKALQALVATKMAGFALFTSTAAATSRELISDQERIVAAYRREGYPDVRVWPSASSNPAGLGSAALTAAMLALDRTHALYVRFTIDEGLPTLLSRIVIQGEGGSAIDPPLCTLALGELAKLLDNRQVAKRADATACSATIAELKFRADDVALTREQLREALFKAGRTRSVVDYATNPIGPHRVEARYTVKGAAPLKVGKLVVRGNFRTDETIIRRELGINEGAPLTTDVLADGARTLRNTGLFDAVNIDMPDLDCGRDRQCQSEVINAIVRVEERYDYWASITVEGGYSEINHWFIKAGIAWENLFGRGVRLAGSGTAGTKLKEVDGTFRIPEWLVKPVLPDAMAFSTELSGLYREQDTPRFGLLTTTGFGVALSRGWPRPRTETQSALSRDLILEYRFRLRTHNIDALRPIGSDMDQSQVPIETRTGSVGLIVRFDHRIDRRGQLAPLSAEDGYYLEGSTSLAGPYFLGQDEFIKFALAASKYFPLGKNGVLRFDARYDQGYPIGDEVLLPDVERFAAGGDGTVRGYPDERLATEIIQVGVPPLDNVSQIRVIPAGGNIRVLASVDAQTRIWWILAGATFIDAGLITNRWSTVELKKVGDVPYDSPDIRPSVGMGLRALTPFGIGALEYAVPLRPRLGDDPRGRIHFYFAARAQF